jgi:hypothetical protein
MTPFYEMDKNHNLMTEAAVSSFEVSFESNDKESPDSFVFLHQFYFGQKQTSQILRLSLLSSWFATAELYEEARYILLLVMNLIEDALCMLFQ